MSAEQQIQIFGVVVLLFAVGGWVFDLYFEVKRARSKRMDGVDAERVALAGGAAEGGPHDEEANQSWVAWVERTRGARKSLANEGVYRAGFAMGKKRVGGIDCDEGWRQWLIGRDWMAKRTDAERIFKAGFADGGGAGDVGSEAAMTSEHQDGKSTGMA